MQAPPQVIVAGAGVAGAAAALLLAEAGVRVEVHPRVRGQAGPLPGGLLWGEPLGASIGHGLPPGGGDRTLIEQRFALLTDSAISIDFRDPEWGRKQPAARTLEAAPLVEELMGRAKDAGAVIEGPEPVEELARDLHGHAFGVRVGGRLAPAPLTILADGSSAIVPDSRGTRGRGTEAPRSDRRAAQVTSFLLSRSFRMDPARINARFGVGDREGVAVDAVLSGIAGDQLAGGFLVTHRDSITAGVEVHPIAPGYRRATPEVAQSVLDRFLSHPFVAPLVRGAPAGTPGSSSRRSFTGNRRDLGGPGYLVIGDAAGFGSSATTFVPEFDLALGSARCAALAARTGGLGSDPEAVEPASEYIRLLHEDGLWNRLESERWLVSRVKWNPRVHREYARLLDDTLDHTMTETSGPKRAIRQHAMSARATAGVRWTDLFRDLLAGGAA